MHEGGEQQGMQDRWRGRQPGRVTSKGRRAREIGRRRNKVRKQSIKLLLLLLLTTENQFGFKSNSSTDLRVFSLKQVIDYYKVNDSPVYLCFLDSSKAFDHVPHSILFSKLVERRYLTL